MNKFPLVTVICTCYNHEDFVIDTIKSVLNQSYSNIEIIIIDDYSIDNSVEKITSFIINYPFIKFIQNRKNLGITKTFNKASKHANGDFLVDLACDDILLPRCIEIQVNHFLETDTELTGVVFGNSEIIDRHGDFISYYFSINKDRHVIDKTLHKIDLIKLLSGGLILNSASSMINRKIFDKLNGYDETLAFEDLDYWIRVLEHYKIVFIDHILTQKRDLNTSLGSQFSKRTSLSTKINNSMNIIFSNVISKYKCDKLILKAILKRVHFNLHRALKSRNIMFIFKFTIQKFKIHYFLIFAK